MPIKLQSVTEEQADLLKEQHLSKLLFVTDINFGFD